MSFGLRDFEAWTATFSSRDRTNLEAGGEPISAKLRLRSTPDQFRIARDSARRTGPVVAITVREVHCDGYPGTSMGFLDNLESNLKSLESQEEGREAADRQQRARESERAQAQATAPFAEQLKKSPFTEGVLTHAARVGHSLRTKVRVTWLGNTLRLEARGRRLELRPTATGVVAVSIEDGNEAAGKPLDLSSDSERLIRDWLSK